MAQTNAVNTAPLANGVLGSWTPGAGTITSADTILTAMQKLAVVSPTITVGSPANGLLYSGGELFLATGASGVTGAITGTDWDTFNAKENAITATTSADYYRGDKTFQTLNTSAVPEGSNLYYTTARFTTAFGTKTTTDLAEGSNLYYTNARGIASTLTGYTSGAGTITSSDTVLGAIQKLNGNVALKQDTIVASTTDKYYRGDKTFQVLDTDAVAEGSNLYFTQQRAIDSLLTGYTPTVGAITAFDSILTAINKLAGGAVPAGFTANRAIVSDGTGALDVSTTTATEIGYVNGVTSSIQTQLNSKPDLSDNNVWTGTNEFQNATTKFSGLTASTVPYLDASKILQSSVVTPTELGYVSGVTSAIQTQLNGKQATGNYITALTGEVTASGPGSVAATVTNSAVIGKVLTGYVSGAGVVAATDTILQAIQKLNGNIAAIGPTTGFTINRALVSDASGNIAVSTTSTTQLQYLNAATGTTGTTSANLVFSASPTFTGTVTIPTSFILGATTVTTTGTQLNYLNAATGTTGITSTNLVFSTSPVLTTPNIGVATATSINGNTITAGTGTLTLSTFTLTVSATSSISGTNTGDANIVVADESADTTCFPLFVTAATGTLSPKSNAGLTYNASTSVLASTGLSAGATGVSSTGNITGTGNTNTITSTGTTQTAVSIVANSLTTGGIWSGTSSSTDTGTRTLFTLTSSSALATGVTLASLTNASTGTTLGITSAGIAINSSSTGTTQNAYTFTADSLTSGFHTTISSSSADTTGRRLLYINNSNAASSGVTTFYINNAAIGPGMVLISASTINNVFFVQSDALTTGRLGQFYSNSSSSSTRGLLDITNDNTGATGTTPLTIVQAAITSTHFKRVANFAATTLWISDGTTPNGNLSAAVGDICWNADGGKQYHCTGTTNWTVS